MFSNSFDCFNLKSDIFFSDFVVLEVKKIWMYKSNLYHANLTFFWNAPMYLGLPFRNASKFVIDERNMLKVSTWARNTSYTEPKKITHQFSNAFNMALTFNYCILKVTDAIVAFKGSGSLRGFLDLRFPENVKLLILCCWHSHYKGNTQWCPKKWLHFYWHVRCCHGDTGK